KGKGTTFNVRVPLKKAEHIEEAAPAEAEAVALTDLHVLIAEDVELNAEILAELLDMEDISSEWAENGQRALEMFGASEAGHFSAILMDMRMPVMDGLTATREIRKLNRPDAATIPIIALTANAFEEDVKQCMQAGMDAHLSKPVDIEQLKAILGRMLTTKEERD
ncbi:MAG: response regulator, partial [bacterium]